MVIVSSSLEPISLPHEAINPNSNKKNMKNIIPLVLLNINSTF